MNLTYKTIIVPAEVHRRLGDAARGRGLRVAGMVYVLVENHLYGEPIHEAFPLPVDLSPSPNDKAWKKILVDEVTHQLLKEEAARRGTPMYLVLDIFLQDLEEAHAQHVAVG